MKTRTASLGIYCVVVLLLMAPLGASMAGELHALVRDRKGQPVKDAVVLAMPTDRRLIAAPKPARNVVDQIDKEFVPYVKAIYVGSLVHFPNKDNIRHQVYSFSPAKQFELPLYAGTAAPPVLFDKPGVVVLGCNIHDWMIGYIYVADTPFFAKTGSEGQADIGALPPGKYLVRVWHPDMDETEQATIKQIAVGAGSAAMEWSLPLKQTFRIPRPMGGHGAGYL